MIKRVLGILIITVFCSVIFPINSDAKTLSKDIDSSHPYFKSIDHLFRLCPSYFDKEYFYPDKIVTRGEFINVLFCQTTENENYNDLEVKIPFSDVKGDENFIKALKISLALNAIGGFEDNTFRDWAEITIMEAIKIMMKIESVNNNLIYGLYNSNKKVYADWKDEYIEYSNRLNLVPNIEKKLFSRLTNKELADLVYRFDVIYNMNVDRYDESLDKEVDYLSLFVKKDQKKEITNISDSISLLNKYYLYPDELKEKYPYKGAMTGLLEGVSDPYTAAYEAGDFTLESTSTDQFDFGFTTKQKINGEWYYNIIDTIEKDSLAYEFGLRKNSIIYDISINEITDYSKEDILSLFPENKKDLINEEKISKYTHTLSISYSNSFYNSSDYLIIPTQISDTRDARIEVIGDNVLYTKIRTFNQKTLSDFEDELREIKIPRDDITAYILDLRSNTGGEIDVLMKISEHIFPKDTTIMKLVDNKKVERDLKTVNYNNSSVLLKNDVPWFLVVDGYTASASEVLGFAIQDLKSNVKVVGQNSYGKGKMQIVFPFVDEELVLTITTGEMKSPKGNTIDQTGLVPDILIESSSSFIDYNLMKDKTILKILSLL